MITLKQLCFLSVLAFTFGLLCSGAYAAGEPAKNVDDDLLRKAGLGTSAKDLLDSLQKWSAGDEGLLLSVDKLARDLDSDSFEERASAAKGLVRIGPPAATPLLNAIQSSGLEASRRALLCLKEINKTWRPELRRAAVRRIAQVASDESVESLLRFLPWAGDDELAEEIYFRLYAFAKGRPELRPLFVPALSDRLPARRAVAALILGRLGSDSQKTAVGALLKDPAAMVRLRAAQGLLAGEDASGVPTLIDLLSDPSVAISWPAEELLHWTAQGDAPTVVIGAASPADRTAANAAWLRWWQGNNRSPKWARTAQDSRRPGLMFICTGTETLLKHDNGWQYLSTKGHIRLYGCDSTARWTLKALGTRSVQLLPGNRILVAQQSTENPSQECIFPPLQLKELDLYGKTLWQAKSLEFVQDYRTKGHRLSNGTTLIDLGKPGGVGPSIGGELDIDGKFEQLPSFNGWYGMPEAIPPNQGPVICTAMLPNRNTLNVRQEVVRETTPAGKVVWEIVTPEPAYWLQPCLAVVTLGFDKEPSTGLDLSTNLLYHMAKLKSTDPTARKVTIEDLLKMGRSAAPATLHLLKACQDPHSEIAHLAFETVRAVGPDALPYLWEAAGDERPLIRGKAIWALGYLHTYDARVVPAILAAARDRNNYVRYNALRALQSVDRVSQAFMPLYIAGLRDTARLEPDFTESVAGWAACYLGEVYGPDAISAASDLIAAARGQDLHLKAQCIYALGLIGSKDDKTVRFVLESFKANRVRDERGAEYIRRACVQTIGNIGLPAIEGLPMLVDVLMNQVNSADLRAAAATAIGQFGRGARSAIPALRKASEDSDRWVSSKAIDALKKIDN